MSTPAPIEGAISHFSGLVDRLIGLEDVLRG